MSVHDLVRKLTELSVTLSSDGGKLIVDGPENVVRNHLQSIRHHKTAIIEFLEREEGKSLPSGVENIFWIRDESGLAELRLNICGNAIKKVFVDIETTGLDPFRDELVLIQLMAGNRVFLIDVGAIRADRQKSSFHDVLRKILEDENILKVFHNGLFDLKFLKYRLFKNTCVQFKNLFDTMLAEQLLTAGVSKHGEHSLDSLCRKYLHIELDKKLQTSFKTGQVFTEEQVRYAVDDVKHLEAIFQIQSDAIVKAGLASTALLEFAIIPAVVDIELAGVHVDTARLETVRTRLLREQKKLEQRLNDIVRSSAITGKQGDLLDSTAMNFRSPVQVKKILDMFGFEVPGTGIEIIEKIDHPFAKALAEYRKVSKLISAFVDKLPKHVHDLTGRIHPKFYQLGTESGRFTCRKPNLQQIPKEQEWRDLFSSPDGRRIVTADYSQIELRILAEFSRDPAFLDAYRTGQDLHSRTAAEMFGIPIERVSKDQRGIAKTINFGLCYGMSSRGLSEGLNIPCEKAESFINRYFRAYPLVKNTLQDLGMKAVKDRCSVTIGGRKRYFPATDSFSGQKALERQGRNTPIQGTCVDILKKAVLYLSGNLKEYDAAIVNLVHDEIVIEARADQAEAVRDIVKRDMVRAGQHYIKSVPIEVDVKIDNVWRK